MTEQNICFPKYRFVICFLALFSGGVLNIINYIVSPLLTNLADAYCVSLSAAGYSRAVITLCMGIGMLGLSTLILKKIGARKTMILSMGTAAAGAMLTAFAPTFFIHLAGRALIGLAFGVNGTACGVLFATWFPDKEKPAVLTAQTLINTLFVVGMYSAVMPVYSAMGQSLKKLFFLTCILCLISLLSWVFFGKDKNQGEQAEGAAKETCQADERRSESPLKGAAKNRDVWILTLVCGFLTISSTGISTYLPSYFSTVRGYDAVAAAGFAGILTAGSIPGALFAGSITSVIKNRKAVTAFCLFICALSMLGLLSFQSTFLIIGALAINGALTSGAYVPIKTFITEMGQSSPDIVSGAYALVFGAGYLLSFFLPAILSFLTKSMGFGGAMYVFAALMALSFVCCLFIRQKKSEQD